MAESGAMDTLKVILVPSGRLELRTVMEGLRVPAASLTVYMSSAKATVATAECLKKIHHN